MYRGSGCLTIFVFVLIWGFMSVSCAMAEPIYEYLVDREPAESTIPPHTARLIGLNYKMDWVWEIINQKNALGVSQIRTSITEENSHYVIDTVFYKAYDYFENETLKVLLEPVKTVYFANKSGNITGHGLFEIVSIEEKNRSSLFNTEK